MLLGRGALPSALGATRGFSTDCQDPKTTATYTTLPARIADPSFAPRTALVDDLAQWSYSELLGEAMAWRDRLAPTEAGDRIACLVAPGRVHVAVQLGIWARAGIAVPLAVSHPPRELDYVLDDARPRIVVVDPTLPQAPHLTASVRARGATPLTLPPRPHTATLPIPAAAVPHSRTGHRPTPPAPTDPALIIYTSGTTGRPKGVLTTHRNLTARITALTAAWGWTATDRILHTLPLHHVHGLVNALACALWSGAAGLRLMVSGSAALPVDTLERWREISGHTLLERYGMTEIGMGISNPLAGERRPGHVGPPLPGVETRIVDDRGRPVRPGQPGEIEVRGPQVFREYRDRPVETAAAFRDGWFRTGDEARIGEGGYFRILGRRSGDIVKTGGYKVSALEVEEVFRTHPAVREVSVVGVPHREWGEQLRAAWVPVDGQVGLAGAELRAWGKERLAPYKVPHEFLAVPRLPLSAVGKVRKAEVRRMFSE